MTVYLVTANLPDGRSLVVGIYANDELASATADRLRSYGTEIYSQVFVTETDVIGA
jgi:hypothetical protein